MIKSVRILFYVILKVDIFLYFNYVYIRLFKLVAYHRMTIILMDTVNLKQLERYF